MAPIARAIDLVLRATFPHPLIGGDRGEFARGDSPDLRGDAAGGLAWNLGGGDWSMAGVGALCAILLISGKSSELSTSAPDGAKGSVLNSQSNYSGPRMRGCSSRPIASLATAPW